MKREYTKQAEKFLASQSTDTILRIKTAISKLPEGDVKKVKGAKNLYRLRIGSIRILFTPTPALLKIEKIDNRGQVYKK